MGQRVRLQSLYLMVREKTRLDPPEDQLIILLFPVPTVYIHIERLYLSAIFNPLIETAESPFIFSKKERTDYILNLEYWGDWIIS